MIEKKRIPVILDGDPGHDDAIAWTLAQASGRLNILAVTSVAGNQTIEKTTYNALRVCTLLGIRAPLAKGCPRPLLTPPMNAPSVHGESGLDGPALPEPDFEPEKISAIELMARVIRECDEKVNIISTGPLTNTATFLVAHPELKPKIERICIMGGGLMYGNWTPAAEFNILVDPEAAKIVFAAGLPILMAGLDVTEKAMLMQEDFERIQAQGTTVSDIVWQWIEYYYRYHRSLGYEGAPMHDPCAVMALLYPKLFTMHDYYVEIETLGDYCKGATVADFLGILGKAPNATCVLDVDRKGFADKMVELIGRYKEVSA